MNALALCLLALQGSPQEAALSDAQDKVARGRYADAVRAYEALAEEFPGTPEAEIAARRAAGNALLGWSTLRESGPAENRVDLILAGDGYELEHLRGFESQASDALKVFERNDVLAEYLDYFNFVRAAVASREVGVEEYGRTFDTAFRGRNSGKIESDVDVDRRRVRALLEEIPAWDDLALVIVKAGQRGTGADGVAAVGERDPKNLLRAFGGAFAGLGDELDEDQGVYMPAGGHPNISSTEEPSSVPWRHWIAAEIPGIGIYPGGLGRVDGVFRPVPSNCVMNDAAEFCPVCREALVLAVHRYVDPIESSVPERRGAELSPGKRMEFEVRVQRPAKHALEVRWWVLPERGAPAVPVPRAGMESSGDRRARGPLPPIALEPTVLRKAGRRGEARFVLDATRLESGRHLVLCRVTDLTRVKGSKHPWVLADPNGLLQSELRWWVRVP